MLNELLDHTKQTWKHVLHGNSTIAEKIEWGAESVVALAGAAAFARFGLHRVRSTAEVLLPKLAITIDHAVPRPVLSVTAPGLVDTLRGHGIELSNLQRLSGDSHTNAFSCLIGEQPCVIRLRDEAAGFSLDKMAAEKFANILPIPKIHSIGKVDDHLFFAISDHAPGAMLSNLKQGDQLKALPHLLDVLDTVHATETGSVMAGPLTIGRQQATWSEFARVGQWRHRWNDLFEKGPMEKEVFEKISGAMEKLQPYLPEERRLLHGDLAPTNVISQGGRITGLIDWELALSGDPVWDLAYLTRTYPIKTAQQLIEKRYQQMPFFAERLRAYQLRQGLDILAGFARKGNEAHYLRLRDQLLPLVHY